MLDRSHTPKILSLALIVSISLLGLPAQAAGAQLAGAVYQASSEEPLIGVTVYAADPASGEVFAADPSDAQGKFSFTDLPAGTYELGVKLSEGLYLVRPAVVLAPGKSQHVNLAVNTGTDGGAAASAAPAPTSARGSAWNNPLTAALIVVGSALVIGLVVEAATDDEDKSSPS